MLRLTADSINQSWSAWGTKRRTIRSSSWYLQEMSHTSGFSKTRSPGPITARLHSETGDLVSRMDRENVWCIHGKTDSGMMRSAVTRSLSSATTVSVFPCLMCCGQSWADSTVVCHCLQMTWLRLHYIIVTTFRFQMFNCDHKTSSENCDANVSLNYWNINFKSQFRNPCVTSKK